MTKTLMQAPKLESKACAHCVGTGLRATVECPRCHGTGSFLTKRGHAARAYMRTLLEKPAAEVAVGDVVWFPVGGLKVATAVLRIERDVGPTRRVRLHGVRRKTNDDIAFTLATNGAVELAYTPDELEEVRAKVEAYQATLTKTGEVSRRPRYRRRDVKRAA